MGSTLVSRLGLNFAPYLLSSSGVVIVLRFRYLGMAPLSSSNEAFLEFSLLCTIFSIFSSNVNFSSKESIFTYPNVVGPPLTKPSPHGLPTSCSSTKSIRPSIFFVAMALKSVLRYQMIRLDKEKIGLK